MKLARWELKIGFFKGLLLGMRHYYFMGTGDIETGEEVEIMEEDVVVYLGVLQIVVTLIYIKE